MSSIDSWLHTHLLERLREEQRDGEARERPAVKWSAVLAVTSLLAFMLAIVFVMGETGAGPTVVGANSGSASFPFVGQAALGSEAEGEAEAAPDHRRVPICHRTHNPHRPFILIRVPRFTVPRHLQHGDIFPVPPGGCPRHVPSPMPTGVPTGVPTHIPTHIPTHEPTHEPTKKPTHVPTPVPTHVSAPPAPQN